MRRRDPIENARVKMLGFLRREIVNSTEDDPLTSIELRHVETKRSLATWRVEEGHIDVEGTVEDGLETAQDDADGLGGGQQYMMVSFYNHGARFANSSPVFRIRGQEDPDEEIEGVKRKLGKDEIAIHALKALTDTNRMLLSERATAGGYLLQSLQHANDTLARYQDAHMSVLTEREKLINENLDREIAREEAAAKIEMTRDALEHAKLLLPSIYAKVKGKALPQLPGRNPKLTPLHELVGQFFATLNEEQLAAIQSTLSPQQQVAMGAIFETWSETFAKVKAEEEEKKNAERKEWRERTNGSAEHSTLAEGNESDA